MPNATALRESLDWLMGASVGLAECDQAIREKKTARSRRPSGEEYQAYLDRAPINGFWADSWPGILAQANNVLTRWWHCWERTQAELQAFPKTLVDDQTQPVIERWSTRLQRQLVHLHEGIKWSRPDSLTTASVELFIISRLPDDWTSRVLGLEAFLDDLKALPKSIDTPAEAAKNTGGRPKGSCKYNAKELVEKFRREHSETGITQAAFCVQEGIGESTFSGYLRSHHSRNHSENSPA